MTARRSRSWLNPKLVLGLSISLAALFGTSALAATKSVSIKNIAFNPASVSIHVGDKVTWTNNETGLYAPMHTVTSDDGHSFDSGDVNPGSSYSMTFNKAGTFAYHCNIHSSMHGTITVTGSTTSPTPMPIPTHTRTKPTATATAKPTVVPVSPTPTSSVKPSPRVSKTVKPSTSPTTSPSSSPSRVVAAGSSSSGGVDGALAWVAGTLIVAVAGGTFVLRRRRTIT